MYIRRVRELIKIVDKKKYLHIESGDGASPIETQRFVITDEGVKLLSLDGYLNALIESISDIGSLIAIIISIFALGISLWTVAHAGDIIHVQLIK